MIPEGNPFHCRASFLSIISNHAFAPCSLSIFRFFKEETLAARAPLALEADLFGLQAKAFIFEKHDIPTVAILAQGTSWAVAATQTFFPINFQSRLMQTFLVLSFLSRLGIFVFVHHFTRSHLRARNESQLFPGSISIVGACPCCPSGPWRRSVSEYIMSCNSCGWLTLTKQVVCMDPAV